MKFLGTKNEFDGSCLRHCAYRKIIAAKMVFDFFFLGGGNRKFGCSCHL